MIKLYYSIVLIMTVMTNLFSQQKTYELPKPIIGWDSLSSKILYPEIYRRAGIQGVFIAELRIDSAGILSKITVQELNKSEILDSTYAIVNSLKSNLKSIQWLPGKVNGRNVEGQLKIPLILILSDSNTTNAIIKMKLFPVIQKDSVPYRGKL